MKRTTADYILDKLREDRDRALDRMQNTVRFTKNEGDMRSTFEAWRDIVKICDDFEDWYDDNEDAMEDDE